MTTTLPGQDTDALLTRLGIDTSRLSGGDLEVRTPITGEVIANLHSTSEADAEAAIARSVQAFQAWREVPAPRRGELVRLFGDELRDAQGGARRARHASRPARSAARAWARCRR